MRQKFEKTIGGHLGLEITKVEEGYMEGTLPVDERTHQPYGQLHGGATVVLAETLGSFGSHLLVYQNDELAVGIQVNCNHLRAARSGLVTGKATLEHRGRSTHVWSITVEDDQGRKIATARLTNMIIPKPKA